jgi:adenylyl cyclase-associated protein
VAARLEDVAALVESRGFASSSSDLRQGFAAHIEDKPERKTRQPAPPTETVPKNVEEYDDFLDASVGRYVELSNKIGGVVAQQAADVLTAFQEQRRILALAPARSKPDTVGWQQVLRSMNEASARIVAVQQANRKDEMYNHLSCVADGIHVLSWITYDMQGFRHIPPSLECVQYFGNKVLQEHRGRFVQPF